ncbi:MAG TPA: LEPR-XLL domain-containing protein [Verrucomicrobiae bacterium]
MKTARTRNRFELEALEPRVLLSGDGLAAGAALGAILSPLLSGMAAEEIRDNNSNGPADTSLVYAPDTQLEDIFGQVSELTPAAAPVPSAVSETASVKANDSADTTRQGQREDSFGCKATGEDRGAGPGAYSSRGISNRTVEHLTLTLRAANAPPQASVEARDSNLQPAETS